jgi:hypothetical protein
MPSLPSPSSPTMQEPPITIDEMLSLIEYGRYDWVDGKRLVIEGAQWSGGGKWNCKTCKYNDDRFGVVRHLYLKHKDICSFNVWCKWEPRLRLISGDNNGDNNNDSPTISLSSNNVVNSNQIYNTVDPLTVIIEDNDAWVIVHYDDDDREKVIR